VSAVFLGVLLTVLPSGQSSPSYVLEKSEVKRIKAVCTYHVDCPNFVARGWVVFAAETPALPGQTDVRTTLEPQGQATADLSPLRRPILRAEVPATSAARMHSLDMIVTQEATLHGRRLRALARGEKPPIVPPLSEAQRKLFLLAYGDIDHKEKSFRQWLQANQLQRRPKENEVDFARRVFVFIRSNFTYDFQITMDRKISHVCDADKADCAGLSLLFTGVLRANDIPARTLYGRWAQSAKPNEKIKGVVYHQSHVIAEFFASGVGWVPVDPATAILYDKSAQGLTYFGQSPGNFLALHVDSNLQLNTRHFGLREAPSLQGPVYYVGGEGSLEPTHLRQDWQVSRVR
jgi:transglutaminase-like putative cysteine protease